MTDNSSSVRKKSLVATMAISLSRVFGLIREQVFAAFFGSGAAVDAFLIAFRIPNLLRDLAAEGALSQSFVAVFSPTLAKDGKEQAHELARQTLGFLTLVLIALITLGEIFAPQIVSIVASGFSGEKFDLTVQLMRILFPYIGFVSLAALLMGFLNSHGKFFIPHSTSTIFNITSISCGLLFAYSLVPHHIEETWSHLIAGQSPQTSDFLTLATAITGMAWGTLIGGAFQLLIQSPVCIRLGFWPLPSFRLNHPKLKQVLRLTGPAILGGAAVQINVLINTEFASFLPDGAISYLSYSFRFMQFPLGVFGVAIAVASAPLLAKLVHQQKTDQVAETLRTSMAQSLYFTLPSAVGLVVLGPEIISMIYERGQFDAADTLQTAFALKAYAIGIAAYALIKIYQPAFLAFGDAKTAMKVSLASIVVNLSLNSLFIFGFSWPHWSLALATSGVALFNSCCLMILFRKKLAGVWNKSLWQEFAKITVSAAFMAAFLLVTKQQVFLLLEPTHLITLVLIGGGAAAYLGVTVLLKTKSGLIKSH